MLAKRSVVALGLTLAAGAAPFAESHYEAAQLLARFAEPSATPRAGVAIDIAGEGGALAARLYPGDGPRPPAVVLVHGVHHLGMNEPRLVRLAQAFAARGFLVCTPQVEALADYSLAARGADDIGRAASFLARHAGRRVGILGISFAGGLAIVAATRPEHRESVGWVATLGAHHDLERVLRYFAEGTAAGPDGAPLTRAPHDYGPLVLVFGRPELFFDALDVPLAREALRLWLHEEFDAARAVAHALSAPGRERLAVLFSHDAKALEPLLRIAASARRDEARAASPSGALPQLTAPLFVLHGADDDVVPPTEALWLDADVPRGVRHEVLVTRALAHASLRPGARLVESARLLTFLARLWVTAMETEPL